MATRKRKQKRGFNFVDRMIMKYLTMRDIRYQPKSNMFGHLESKATTVEEKEAFNRLIMPWLYSNLNFRGVIRDTDVLELRRLSLAPIVQLNIVTRQEEVKKVSWAIVETDQKDKKFLKESSPYKRKGFISSKRRQLKVKAEEGEGDPKLAELADEAAMLLSNPNSQGQTFEHLVGMLIADHAEAGDAVWVMSFMEKDLIFVHDEGRDIDKVRVKKGARPVEIECRDVLQFNKDMDEFGQLKGYWFVPNTTGGTGFAGVQTYVTKDEVVWFPNDPRSNRFYGFGDVEKARDVIDILMLSMEQETQYFAEGMVSPGALTLDSDDASQADIEQIIDYYSENIKGHPEKMWILNRKASWLPFTYNYRELQFLERKLWDSKIITSCFKLNTSILGINPDMTNRATMYQEKIIAQEKGILPILKMIEYYVNTQFLWKYYDKRLSFVYDPMEDMETMEKKGTIILGEYREGLITKDEARKEMGWDEAEDGSGDEFREQAGGNQESFGGSDGGFGTDIFGKTKKKQENSGAIDIPTREFNQLLVPIRDAYGSTIDDIIKGLSEFKDEIDLSSFKEPKQLRKAVSRSGIVAMITEIIQKNGLVEKVTSALVTNSAEDMLKEITTRSQQLDLGFDKLREEDAIRRLTERKMSYYNDIPDTLTDTVIQTLVDTIDKGASFGEAIETLKVLREDFTTNRAETIVRTEVGRSRREATLIFGEQNKDLLDKKWIATKDRRTRDSHRAMDGKTIGMDQSFVVNYSLDNNKQPSQVEESYPGESKYGINCRCELDLIKRKDI